MSCTSCTQAIIEKEQALVAAKREAKAFAIQNSTNVFLYYNELGEIKFMAEEPARLCGIQPTAGIVTPFVPQ